MQFNFRKMMLAATALTAVVGATAHSASAQTSTFAQFFQSGSPVQAFTLTQSGANTSFTATNANVLFSLAGTTYTDTLLTITSTSTAAPTLNVTNKTINQAIHSVTVSFTKGGVNLLTATANNATLSGTDGGNSATLAASLPPDNLHFTSSVVDFTGATAENFNISLSSVTPLLEINSSTKYLTGFTAAGTGTFASNVVNVPNITPEASDVAFAVVFGAGLMGLVIRARRRNA